MLSASYRMSMFRLQPAPFQLFIIFNRMLGVQNLPTHNTDQVSPAPARALRVGRGEHARHATSLLKVPRRNVLFTLHAIRLGARQHVIGCHGLKESITFGPIQIGAIVPRAIFTTLI